MALTTAQAQNALIAFNRFGLGAKPGGPERIGPNAKARLIAEVNRADIAEITTSGLPSYAKACHDSQVGSEEDAEGVGYPPASHAVGRRSVDAVRGAAHECGAAWRNRDGRDIRPLGS